MKTGLPDLSKNQWEFLALLKAFNEPIPLHVAEVLSPLSPGQFMELLGQKKKSGWIKEVGAGQYALKDNLPKIIIEKIHQINTPERISSLAEKLQSHNFKGRINPRTIDKLMVKSGATIDIAGFEIDLARKALKNNDIIAAIKEFQMAANRLYEFTDKPGHGALFVSTILELTNLSFHTSTRLADWPTSVKLMKKAMAVSKRMGDKRSHAMLNLYMGRIFFGYGKLAETLDSLSKGLKEAEQLGDEDILERSAPYVGLYYYLRGMFSEALPHFERAMKTFESKQQKLLIHEVNFVVALMGFTLTLLGRFHDSIGFFACHWRLAKANSQHTEAATFRALLGSILLIIKKYREAAYHLEGACEEADQVNNEAARYLAEGSLIYLHFSEGRIDKARAMIDPTLSLGLSGDMIHQYTTPHYLEMLFELDRIADTPHPMINFKNLITNVMKGPNIHLKGVAMRLTAKQAALKKESISKIQSYLSESEAYLKQSGDPIESAKIRLESARLELAKGDHKKARSLAREAIEKFGDYVDVFFPDDLKELRENANVIDQSKDRTRYFIQRFLSIFESFSFEEGLEETFVQLLKTTNRLFGTERGALFWINEDKDAKGPRLMASYNFSEIDLSDPEFKSSMASIHKAFKTKKLIIKTKNSKNRSFTKDHIREFICIPIDGKGETRGVLYHDNIYLENNFKNLDPLMLRPLIRHLSGYISQNVAYNRLKKEKDRLAFESRSRLNDLQKDEIQFQSPVMTRLMSQIDHVASLDSTVLLQGETGVGKELLARRIHHMSPRRSKHFEVVDLTAIPENLLQSELFGYEKGAFTGADRQKQGRFEPAHKGTLFLDEIGEIPLSFQVKLLRVLQEKRFVRIGGAKEIISDFRLIVATNRNLEEEVSAGRFRQDLYYRLNVIPITIPPLRERGDDIILLAQFFLTKFAIKHNREKIELTPEDEKRLKTYPWPGNVRELKNIIERSVILARAGRIDLGIIDRLGESSMGASLEKKLLSGYPTMDDVQRHYIRLVLEKTGGKKYGPDGAAKILGLKRTTLHARMKKLGML